MIKNIEMIHPLKRDSVRRGMEYIESQNRKSPIITKVIVFGSASRNDCTEDSDIDLCIFSDKDCHDPLYRETRGELPLRIGDLCDILKYNKLTDRFKTEVEKGVVVYEL